MTDLEKQKETLRLRVSEAIADFINETGLTVKDIAITPTYIRDEGKWRLLNCGEFQLNVKI